MKKINSVRYTNSTERKVNRNKQKSLTLTERGTIMGDSTTPVKQYFGFDGMGGWGGCNGCNNSEMLFMLFFLVFLNNGNWGNWNRYGNYGSDPAADVAAVVANANGQYNAERFNTLSTTLGQLKDNQFDGFSGVQSALCQGFAGINSNLTQGFSGLNTNIQNGFYGINTSILNSKYETGNKIDACCCATQTGLANLQAAYDRGVCAIINAGNANTQAIKDMLGAHWSANDKERICALESQLSEQKILAAIAAKSTTTPTT